MYKFDAATAAEADNISAYLDETGKYKGKFIRAEKLISSNKGTHGIGFTFEDESKRTARFDLWTVDNMGKQLMGYKSLQAILAVLRFPPGRDLKIMQATVDRYNFDTRQTEKVQAETFPDLINRPVGLVMRNTEYVKMREGRETGETGWRLELVVPFQADTELTASEILDKKTQPGMLAKMVEGLRHRPLKGARPAAPRAEDSAGGPPAGHHASSGFDDMDDGSDIPFVSASPMFDMVPRKLRKMARYDY